MLDLGTHRLPDLTQPERIFQLLAPGLPSDFPPLLSLDNRPTNLPVQPNALVGRQVELLELGRLLRSPEVRLMTLTGIGGSGKTRLALQAGADRLADFADGVFFVPLDQLSDPGLIATSIASALCLELSGSQSVEELLISHLRSHQVLLILDNFEHLLEGAPLVSRLLSACPQLKILATSREALRLRGEREFPLSPLPLPDLAHPQPPEQLAQFASVAIFLQRAQAVRPDFQVTAANAPAIAEICTTLDGLPLALELAAARLRMFTPQALLARLKAQPGLQLLSGGPRDLPTRQQTLQNAIQWSYDLLSPPEQALFRRLGVFAGGFSLEAAEAVCSLPGEPADQSFDLLTSLVEKSLVRFNDDQENSDSASQPRYSLLFLLRHYALDQLQQAGESSACNQTHAIYFLTLVEQAEPNFTSNHQKKWYMILTLDHDNLRAALRWAISVKDTTTTLRLSGSLWRFWVHQGYLKEGRVWVEQVLALPGTQDAPPELLARVLIAASALADFMGDYPYAISLETQRLEIFQKSGDIREIARSKRNLGAMMIQQGESEAGSQLIEESIALFRKTDDVKGLALSLNKLAIYAMDQGDFRRARTLLDESLGLVRSLADLESIAYTLGGLGSLDIYEGNYASAILNLEECRAIHQSLGQQLHSTEALAWLGYAFLLQGKLHSARSNFNSTLKDNLAVGEKYGIAVNLEGLAGVAALWANPQRSAILFGAAEALRQQLGMPLLPSDQKLLAPLVREARTHLKNDDFARAWSAGQEMLANGLDKVVAYALEPDEISEKALAKTPLAGLTTRETEILRLVAQGLSDAQIAEKLFISPRTVNAHLTSIYKKLGVNSRAAATRYAIENGLG
jgi:predicted ATPase/DNA-binding CsgD family transcriptional regulator